MKTETKPLVDALTRISRITGADMIGMTLTKGKLTLSGENAGRALSVSVPFKDKATWELAIPKSVLDQAFKGRKEIDLSVAENGNILFKTSAFDGNYATHPFTNSPDLVKDGALAISSKHQDFISEALSATALSPIFESDTLFLVHLSKGSAIAACLDQLQFALYEAPAVKGAELALSFPTQTFNTVVAAAAGTDYTLAATSAAICAWAEDWTLLLPFVQNEAAQTIEDVKGLVDQFGNGMVRCSAKKFITAIQAAQTAIEVGGAIKLEVKDDVLRVSGQSSIGAVSEKLECKLLAKKARTMFINPVIVMQLLASAPSEFVEFGVHDDKFFFIRADDDAATITYGCLLSEGE